MRTISRRRVPTGEVRPWLALFEIYRLERRTTEFAELARRFYEEHGNTEYWRKVRYFGREIDPGNFLYREDVDALQTIAPGTARKEDAESFDPARPFDESPPEDELPPEKRPLP